MVKIAYEFAYELVWWKKNLYMLLPGYFTFPLLIACPHYMTYDFQEYYYCTDLRKVRINEPTRISWNETDGFVWVNHLL